MSQADRKAVIVSIPTATVATKYREVTNQNLDLFRLVSPHVSTKEPQFLGKVLSMGRGGQQESTPVVA